MAITDWWNKKLNGVSVCRDAFIETGTKQGNTLWEAKDLFPVAHSIEINKKVYELAVDRFAEFPNVHIHLGDSRKILPTIIDSKMASTFYLDAHCEGSPSTVPESETECPLLDELKIIVAADWDHKPMVIIDDINMFSESYWNDPGSNHDLFRSADWPRLHDIEKIMEGYCFHEDKINRVGIWT